MMKRRSFFERLTGSTPYPDVPEPPTGGQHKHIAVQEENHNSSIPETQKEGQLTVDVWNNPKEIIIQTIVGGVRPEDLDVSIMQDQVTIRGRRSREEEVSNDNFYYRELYWGTFSRSVVLPQEVDIDNTEAALKHGLLTIRLPKLDKQRTQKLKVKVS